MTRHRRTRLITAGSFLILLFAVVPGMAYTGAWSGPEGEIDVIIAQEPAGSHHHDHAGDPQNMGIQQCRVGPSKCTGQPSFVSTTSLEDQSSTLVPPQLSHEIFGPGHDLAMQPPVYRQKPPPREA